MADVTLYHPGLDTTVGVPEASVWHYRASGWITEDEHQEQVRADAAAEEAAQAVRKEAQPGKGQGSSVTAAGKASGDKEN